MLFVWLAWCAKWIGPSKCVGLLDVIPKGDLGFRTQTDELMKVLYERYGMR